MWETLKPFVIIATFAIVMPCIYDLLPDWHIWVFGAWFVAGMAIYAREAYQKH